MQFSKIGLNLLNYANVGFEVDQIFFKGLIDFGGSFP